MLVGDSPLPAAEDRLFQAVTILAFDIVDLQRHSDGWALLDYGKYHDRVVSLRPEVVRAYLVVLGIIAPDELGEALIVADGNFARGHRLSRRGVRYVVDGYLRTANVKRPHVSNHALRHTSTRAGLPLHMRPAGHSRLPPVCAGVDHARTNPALKVPVEL